MQTKSHLTAISRKTLPVPTRWLMKAGLMVGTVMDYGCGKCASVNPPKWINHDPYYHAIDLDRLRGSFSTIICVYVLCTLPDAERKPVLADIQSLLTDDGVAYIAVRNDKPKQGWGLSSRGTYQGRVRKIVLPLLYKNAQFRIYKLTKTTNLG